MRMWTRGAASVVAAGAIVALSAPLALAATSTGWMPNNASRLLTVDGCDITQSGFTRYVHALEEDNSCPGAIGLQVRVKTSSGTATTGTEWGAYYIRVDASAPITSLNVHH